MLQFFWGRRKRHPRWAQRRRVVVDVVDAASQHVFTNRDAGPNPLAVLYVLMLDRAHRKIRPGRRRQCPGFAAGRVNRHLLRVSAADEREAAGLLGLRAEDQRQIPRPAGGLDGVAINQ